MNEHPDAVLASTARATWRAPSTGWRGGCPSPSSRSPRSPTTTAGPGRPVAASCSAQLGAHRFGLANENPVRFLRDLLRARPARGGDRRRVPRAASNAVARTLDDDLARPPSHGARQRARRVPVRRVRRAPLAAGLLGRPRRARRRHAEGGLGPGAAVRRRRPALPARLLPPAHGPLGLAAGVLDRGRPEDAAGRPGHRSPTACRSRSPCRSGTASVAAHVWRSDVGRVPLYLLDTEIGENSPLQRWVTARLYEGNRSIRLAQYALLGVGAVRALEAMCDRARAVPPERGPRRARHAWRWRRRRLGEPSRAATDWPRRSSARRRPLRLHDPHPGAGGQRDLRPRGGARASSGRSF